jgi:riboflavin-specific deaminase-like protein
MRKSSVQVAYRAPAADLVDEEEAWTFVRSIVRGRGAVPDARIELTESKVEEKTWHTAFGITAGAARLLDLCIPLCTGARARDLVVAHLGQSLDGRVAVPPGSPRLITGPEDLRHTHRLRALCDAVIVGATTVYVDDPRLTTRLVPGDHPARVVLDPRARLPQDRGLFTDAEAPSLVVVGRQYATRYAELSGVDVVALTLVDGVLPVGGILAALRARGLRRVFIEGGGVTVSRFLDAGVLDRLHVAIASRIVGTGAPAIQLHTALLGGVTSRARSYLLGTDVLFDCDLRSPGAPGLGLA